MTRPLSRRALIVGAPSLAALGACGDPVGTVLPDVEFAALPGLVGRNGWPVPGIAPDEFRRGVTVLNLWASWCPYCQEEHDALMRLSRDIRFRIVGAVYRDTAAKAVGYLRRAGNPYAAVGRDDGRLARATRIQGVPASFVINRSGRVLARVRGEMNDGNVASTVLPAVRRALDSRETPTG